MSRSKTASTPINCLTKPPIKWLGMQLFTLTCCKYGWWKPTVELIWIISLASISRNLILTLRFPRAFIRYIARVLYMVHYSCENSQSFFFSMWLSRTTTPLGYSVETFLVRWRHIKFLYYVTNLSIEIDAITRNMLLSLEKYLDIWANDVIFPRAPLCRYRDESERRAKLIGTI